MKVAFNSARCGGGKTIGICQLMARDPGLYIYAVDRVEEMSARKDLIEAYAREEGTTPVIRLMHSRDNGDAERMIGERVQRIPATYGHGEHTIVLITHAALMLCPSYGLAFGSWAVLIDEDPKAFGCLSLNISMASSRAHLAEHYDLMPERDGLFRVMPKPTCPTPRQYAGDDLLGDDAMEFRVRAGRDTLLTDLRSWDDLTDEGRKRLTCFSVWSLENLANARLVYIVANAFERTLTYKLNALDPDIEFVESSLLTPRPWTKRPVTVRYYVQHHVAGTGFWTRPQGQRCVETFLRHIASLGDAPTDHYWCKNKALPVPVDCSIPGPLVSAKIAGSNAYRDMTKATILYAAKPSPAEAKALRLLSGGKLDGDDIRRDRECEDILQVALRSSLRVPDDTRPVEVRVYDQRQADFLASYLRDAYGFDVSLEYEDIGIDDPKNGVLQKKGARTNASKGKPVLTGAEKQARYRERQKAKAAQRREAALAKRKVTTRHRATGLMEGPTIVMVAPPKLHRF